MSNITIQDLNDLSINLTSRANALPVQVRNTPAWGSLENQVTAVTAIFQVSPVDTSVAMAALSALQSSVVALEQANGIASPATPQPAPAPTPAPQPAPAGGNPTPSPAPAGGQVPVPTPTPAPTPQPAPAGGDEEPSWLNGYHTRAIVPIETAVRAHDSRLDNHETRLVNLENGGVRGGFSIIGALIGLAVLSVLSWLAQIIFWDLTGLQMLITVGFFAVVGFIMGGLVAPQRRIRLPRRRQVNQNQSQSQN